MIPIKAIIKGIVNNFEYMLRLVEAPCGHLNLINLSNNML
jgi:hypothetical protein